MAGTLCCCWLLSVPSLELTVVVVVPSGFTTVSFGVVTALPFTIVVDVETILYVVPGLLELKVLLL